MKYQVKFVGSKVEKEQQALKEVKRYLGPARYLHVRRTAVDALLNAGWSETRYAQRYNTVRFIAGLVGVRGYFPVRAMAREVLHIVRTCAGDAPKLS